MRNFRPSKHSVKVGTYQATSLSEMSPPDLYKQTDLSPRLVAATCRLAVPTFMKVVGSTFRGSGSKITLATNFLI